MKKLKSEGLLCCFPSEAILKHVVFKVNRITNNHKDCPNFIKSDTDTRVWVSIPKDYRHTKFWLDFADIAFNTETGMYEKFRGFEVPIFDIVPKALFSRSEEDLCISQ